MTATDAIHPVDHLIEIAIQETIPLGMQIDVTYRCDLACVHCYLKDRSRKELTVEEYRRLLAELADLGCLFLVFSGGDPFVRQDLMEILRIAAEHRFSIRLITHAQAISDHVADELAGLGLNRVYVSVYHALEEIHDRVTGRPGSLRATTGGIRRLSARGIPVTIKCPVFCANADAHRVMSEYARSLGADLELSATIRPGNDRSIDLVALNLDVGQAAAVACASLESCSVLETARALPRDDRPCLAGHTSAYIGPDGTVQPCLDYEVACGSVRERSFGRIWFESPVLTRLRGLRRKDFKDCLECPDFSLCRLCPAWSLMETGDPTGVAQSSCRETRALRLALSGAGPGGPDEEGP